MISGSYLNTLMEKTFWNIMEQAKLFLLALSAVFPTIAGFYLND